MTDKAPRTEAVDPYWQGYEQGLLDGKAAASPPSVDALDVERVARVIHSMHAGGSTDLATCLRAADDRANASMFVNRYVRLTESSDPPSADALWAKRMASALYRGYDYTVTPEDIQKAARLASEDRLRGGTNNGPRWHNDNVDGWKP